jgi:hypothetical protein
MRRGREKAENKKRDVMILKHGWGKHQLVSEPLFYCVNTDRFLLLLLGRDNSHRPITPNSTLATTGNKREQQIQPIRNEEKVKNRFYRSNTEEDIREQQVATLATTQ